MNLSQDSLARFTLFLTIFLLAVISLLSYQKIHDLINFDKKVIHTHEVLYKLEKLVLTVKDAESGQRGYLLSSDSLFLFTYNNSKLKTDSLVEEIRGFTSDNAVQLRKLDTITSLIQKRYDLMNVLIHFKSTEYIAPEVMLDLLKKGKATMDELKNVISRSQKEEEDLLYIRTKEKDSLVITTPIFSLVLSFFSLLLILFSYYTLTQELRKKILVQRELELKIEELNRSNSELEQFAYVASHDLQEPLRKIRSFGDRLLFKHSAKLDNDAKVNVQKMHDAASRMQKLIEDLLGFSRLVRSENKFELTNLNELVRAVLNDLDEPIKASNAKIETGFLPVINAVPSQMNQLFQNLISNAVKFSKKDVSPIIKINHEIVKGNEIRHVKQSAANDNFHKIIINDNGIGFDEQYLDRIFIIFQRLHGKLEYGGTGIGLAVCKKIVANHGGYITAHSSLGKGSSFFVFLPAS